MNKQEKGVDEFHSFWFAHRVVDIVVVVVMFTFVFHLKSYRKCSRIHKTRVQQRC